MFARTVTIAGFAIFVSCLIGSGSAFASVKCQCNNGSLSYAMDADYDDDDAEDSCNEACSSAGGGRVWRVDTDQDDSDDVTIRRDDRREERPTPRR